MIAQWAKGLEEPIQKSGCLLLCYLWAGWLWSLPHRGRMQETAYPTVGTVNDSYDFLVRRGAIGEDCYVWQAQEVVAFPWHYWDDCHLPGAEPQLTVEKIEPLSTGHVWPLEAAGAGNRIPPYGAMVADITRWSSEGMSHFTGICQRPAAYFDPWVVSRIAAKGSAESVRRVTLASK